MSTFEEHYTVKELAEMWKLSRSTVARHVQRYSASIPDFSRKARSRYGPIKRHYATWRVPKSVAERIYRDLIGA